MEMVTMRSRVHDRGTIEDEIKMRSLNSSVKNETAVYQGGVILPESYLMVSLEKHLL